MRPKEGLNLKHPSVWLATWFGCGFLKPAPGTWGSAAAIPFGLIIFDIGGLAGLMIAIALVSLAGIWAAEQFNRSTSSHDSGLIVIDEVAGQWVALLPALHLSGFDPFWIGLSFLLFRIFDIFKPWPVSVLDKKVSGGLGVMADDLAAGIYAGLCVTGGALYAGI